MMTTIGSMRVSFVDDVVEDDVSVWSRDGNQPGKIRSHLLMKTFLSRFILV